MSSNHSPFKDFDFELKWVYFLHVQFNEINDTDLMNVSYVELGKDVFTLSDISSNDSDILAVLTATSPVLSKVDE